MNHLFVPYELAVKLKDVGFNENCFGGFDAYKELRFDYIGYVKNSDFSMPPRNHTAAPLYQQVVDWLREKHDLNIGMSYFKIDTVSYWEYRIHYKDVYGQGGEYYHALTKAIEKALKLINQ